MNKRGIALFLVFLVFLIPTVDAFSFGDVFDAIGNFFKGIFGKKAVGIQQQCECITDDNCNIGYYCKNESIVCNPPYMSEFNGLCKPLYTLTVNKQGTGFGSVSSNPPGINCGTDCSESYQDGTSVTLTAIPMDGSSFTGWGEACTGNGTCIINMNSNKTVTAIFNQQSYTLTANPTSGNAPLTVLFDLQGEFISGTQFTWYFGDETMIPTNSLTSMSHTYQVGNYNARVKIMQPGMSPVYSNYVAINVTSISQPQNYTLTVVKSGSGTVTGTSNSTQTNINCGSICSLPYNSGTNITLTATPSTGYTFSHWGEACSGIETCTLIMNSDKTVNAIFNVTSNLCNCNPTLGGCSTGQTCVIGGCQAVDEAIGHCVNIYTLTANPTSGNAPLTVAFVATENQILPNTTNVTSSTPTGSFILTQLVYEWNFGDDTVNITTDNIIQHTYQNVGDYIAFVNIKQDSQIIGVSNNVTISVTSPSGPGGDGSGGGSSSGGGGGGPSGCVPQWSCTLWSSCSKETNTQTRTCSDFNNCNTNIGKPSEIQSCTPTLADQLGISSMGENIGGEIQDFISEGGKLKSTYIALILLFILIIVCSLLIYFRGPFRKKKIMDNEPLSKFSDEKGKLKDISDLSVFKKIEITDPIIKPAVESVKKAKSDGFTRKEIEIELRSKGWTEKQIQDILRNVF